MYQAAPHRVNQLIARISRLETQDERTVLAMRLQLPSALRAKQQVRVADVPFPVLIDFTRQNLKLSPGKMHAVKITS